MEQLQTIENRLKIHEYCIENNIPLDKHVWYYSKKHDWYISAYFEIKTFCMGIFEPYNDLRSIPPEYKGKILDIHVQCDEHQFEEYEDIDNFTKMLKEDGYKRIRIHSDIQSENLESCLKMVNNIQNSLYVIERFMLSKDISLLDKVLSANQYQLISKSKTVPSIGTYFQVCYENIKRLDKGITKEIKNPYVNTK